MFTLLNKIQVILYLFWFLFSMNYLVPKYKIKLSHIKKVNQILLTGILIPIMIIILIICILFINDYFIL